MKKLDPEPALQPDKIFDAGVNPKLVEYCEEDARMTLEYFRKRPPKKRKPLRNGGPPRVRK